MFQLPSDLRHRNRRREAGSMLMSMTLVTSVVAGMMLGGGQQVAPYEDVDEPLLVHLIEAAPAPVARLPAGGAAPAPSVEQPTVEPPPAKDDAVPPADAAPAAITSSSTPGPGAPEGPGGPGEGPGDGIGPGKGPGPGAGDGPGGPGRDEPPLREDLVARRKVRPRYPASAEARSLGETRCSVMLTIDERGTPASVDLSGCPSAFRDEAGRAAMAWRFAPRRVAGIARPSRYHLVFVFRPER
ncbi:MAG: energy transducer TonB [Alphaproteobacteria bacterium]|nr:energy transducer TonB [Alphaproteobacteria bacterium]